jgi:hypothetical protein
MIGNHADVVQRAFDESNLPPPDRNVDDVLEFTQRTLALLPAEEKAGWVKSRPGAENTSKLPDGTLVRVSRIMYASGQMIKIMNSAPNGGPQWVDEGIDDASLYVPFLGAHTLPSEPPPPSTAGFEARLAILEEQVRVNRDRMEAINTRFDGESSEIHPQIEALNKESRDGHTHSVRIGFFSVNTSLPRKP